MLVDVPDGVGVLSNYQEQRRTVVVIYETDPVKEICVGEDRG